MKPLKKEFSDKDKKRMRALLTGTESSRETMGIGYRKVDEVHNEGDIWEEDDRKWTIKKAGMRHASLPIARSHITTAWQKFSL